KTHGNRGAGIEPQHQDFQVVGTLNATEAADGNGNGGDDFPQPDYNDPNFQLFLDDDGPQPQQPRQLPEIYILNAKQTAVSEVIKQTEAAIIKTGRPVFNRGGQLVEPIWQVQRTNENPPRTIKQCVLVPINVNRMINILTKWVCVYIGE